MTTWRCSTRSSTIRHANREGRRAGAVARLTGDRMSRDRARKLAGELGVSDRWLALFTKHFVRAALQSGHREPTPEARYGVP